MLAVLPLLAQLFAAEPQRALSRGADSAAVLRAAKEAQQTFERSRRVNLPWGDGSGGRCDVRVGRYCYWHDVGHDQYHPKEPEVIGRYRARLVTALDSAAERLPGDAWIAGQRVRYLVESGRFVEGVSAARACRAERWWCDALAGFAFHGAQDFARADSAFAIALRAMPEAERCRWTDLSALLAEAAHRSYRRLDCAGRAALAARWWLLADPLYMIAGNERRTEHYVRHVHARLQRDAREGYDTSWGDDMYEIAVRYGWATSWTRARPTGLIDGTGGYNITGHEPAPAFPFFPEVRAPDDTALRAHERWIVTQPIPRERYAPPYAKAFVPLADHQTARFRRGDSTLVVAAYDVREDTLFASRRVEAALALARDDSTPPVVARRERAGPVETLVATVPWAPALTSVEVMAPERKHAARARFSSGGGLARSGALALSDILLVEPRGAAAPALAELVARGDVAPSGRVKAGAKLALYWEEYGLAEGTKVTSTLTVSRGRAGWLRRAGEALRVAPRASPVRIHWQDTPASKDGVAARSLALDLSSLAPGRWTIDLVARPEGREALRASREIEILREGAR